jgi:hypothetical protein
LTNHVARETDPVRSDTYWRFRAWIRLEAAV